VLPDLPEKHFKVIQVSMTGRQASLYEDARSRLELSLKSMDNVTFRKSLATYFQQRSALLQICACPEAIDPSFSDESAKLIALDALVKEVVDTKRKKLIIWSFYSASIESIIKRYAKYNPILLDGSTTAVQRAESIKKFQSDPTVLICVANPAAAGAGVTLHAASDAAYISFSNQAAHFLQSLDRIHRRGQKSSTTDYYLFVCRGTIEEGEVQRLREKEVRQSRLLGDNVKWPNSLDEALAELLPIYV
jgi:SNF2 family DNA or RNA helicase